MPKLYNSIGPNPRVVNMFLAEKGIDFERVQIDLMGGENRQDAYKAKNPSGNTPALELDNGEVLAEITAICEYIDELHPDPPLIGTTPEERAATRMWVRRIDLGIVEPMANGFRYSLGLAMFQDRVHCIPQAADDLKAIAVEEKCENCGADMIVRPGRRGFFLGCTKYPKCKGTREPGEATLEKIMAATGG